MNWIKNALKNCLKNGIRISYSTGKIFDPRGQVRTDAISDIDKKDKEKRKKKLDEMFNIEKEEDNGKDS